MIYKVGLLGAAGRMGTEVAALLADGFVTKGAAFELADAVGEKSGNLVAVEGVKIRALDESPREPVHVWIDFSQPSATVKLLEQIECPILIATTGFDDRQQSLIRSYSERHPVLLASNTSPGINLLLKLIKSFPKGPSFQVVLSEEHHRYKKDSPSGTAKTLKVALEQAGFSEVPVSVVRAGGIKGIHTIKLVSDHESIELRHEAFDRTLFAEGAIQGARFLVNQTQPGLYSMEDVFGG